MKLDVRVISATHKNLSDEVRKGNFREDLFFRVMGLPIDLPPLRERGSDVLILAKHFMDDFVKTNKISSLSLAADAKDKLLKYPFPGNIRELKAVIELAAVMADGKEIQAKDISYFSLQKENMFLMENKTLRQHTCDIVNHYLKKHNGDVIETAKALDIGKSTIYKMIQEGEVTVE